MPLVLGSCRNYAIIRKLGLLLGRGNHCFQKILKHGAMGLYVVLYLKKHKGLYWVSEAVFGDADTDTLTADEKDTIDTVLNSYGKMEPYQLRAQTHVELPWQEARRGLDEFDRGDRIITKDSMGDYYGSL